MPENTISYPVARTLTAPVVVDLGKTKAKNIKNLKRGGGKLMEEIFDAAQRVRAGFGPEAENKEFVPIVLIYRKKAKRRNPFGF